MNTSEHFDGYVERTDSCWLWRGGKDLKGYGIYRTDGKSVRAHRYAYKRAFGEIPGGQFVLHRCDVPSCVRPDHLWAGTHAENMADMVSKGRQATGSRHGSVLHPERQPYGERNGHCTKPERTPRGEAAGLARLTEADVQTIRATYVLGTGLRALGRRFGVSKGAVEKIVHGKTWRHIPRACELEPLDA